MVVTNGYLTIVVDEWLMNRWIFDGSLGPRPGSGPTLKESEVI